MQMLLYGGWHSAEDNYGVSLEQDVWHGGNREFVKQEIIHRLGYSDPRGSSDDGINGSEWKPRQKGKELWDDFEYYLEQHPGTAKDGSCRGQGGHSCYRTVPGTDPRTERARMRHLDCRVYPVQREQANPYLRWSEFGRCDECVALAQAFAAAVATTASSRPADHPDPQIIQIGQYGQPVIVNAEPGVDVCR